MKLWIRVDACTPRDPHVAEFAEMIGSDIATAVGTLTVIWCVMAEHAADGWIGKAEGNEDETGRKAIPNAVLERWATWSPKRGKPRGTMARAFRELFVESDGYVRGWAKRQGALIERMERDRERKNPRKLREESTEIPRNSAPTERNGTVRNKKQDQQQKPSASRARGKREQSASRNGATPESPPDAPSPDAAPDAARDRVTWLTPAREAWERYNGPGSFMFGQAAKLLSPLRKSGLAPEVIGERLARYCAERVNGFCTLADFAQHHQRWEKPPPDIPDLDEGGWMTPELERATRPPAHPML